MVIRRLIVGSIIFIQVITFEIQMKSDLSCMY